MTKEVNVEVRAFNDLIHDNPMPFEAPRRGSLRPEVAAFWWRQIAYVFSLEDPRAFPALGRDRFSNQQLEIFDRFLEAADELAQSEVLNGEYSVTIDFAPAEELSVDASFPRGESVRGLAVLFRQFYSDQEFASFTAARKALGAAAKDRQDAACQQRLNLIRAWKKAHGRMHGEQMEILVLEGLVEEGRAPQDTLKLHRRKPAELISLYNYGELIHFGEKRERLKELVGGGPFEENWTKMEFLISLAGFSHFYVGFAELIEAALREPGT